MYFIVNGDKVYGENKNISGKYPLVSITVEANGGITVKDEGEGVTEKPKGYRASAQEVIAMFGITATAAYKPRATITGNDPVIIYLDEANKVVTLTISNPALGDFSAVASSNTNVARVTEADSAFTIVPVAVGDCIVTGKWTPTDTDFAPTVVSIPVSIRKRQIEFVPVREQSLTKSVDKTIALTPNVGSSSSLSYTVLSSDTGICSPAMSVEEGHGNDLVLTVADTSPLGVAIISVLATDTNSKADDSEVMKFKVRVCDTAVTITAIDNLSLEAGKSQEITVTCAGAEIREVTTSDATKVTVEKTAKLKFKVTAVGEANATATITVYCDKRGYGEDSEDLTVTIT